MMAGTCPESVTSSARESPRKRFLQRPTARYCNADFDCSFVTLVLAELDPRSHRLTVANAGHRFRSSAGLAARSRNWWRSIRHAAGHRSLTQFIARSLFLWHRATSWSFIPMECLTHATEETNDSANSDSRAALAQAPQGVAAVGEAILAALRESCLGTITVRRHHSGLFRSERQVGLGGGMGHRGGDATAALSSRDLRAGRRIGRWPRRPAGPTASSCVINSRSGERRRAPARSPFRAVVSEHSGARLDSSARWRLRVFGARAGGHAP